MDVDSSVFNLNCIDLYQGMSDRMVDKDCCTFAIWSSIINTVVGVGMKIRDSEFFLEMEMSFIEKKNIYFLTVWQVKHVLDIYCYDLGSSSIEYEESHLWWFRIEIMDS